MTVEYYIKSLKKANEGLKYVNRRRMQKNVEDGERDAICEHNAVVRAAKMTVMTRTEIAARKLAVSLTATPYKWNEYVHDDTFMYRRGNLIIHTYENETVVVNMDNYHCEYERDDVHYQF